MAFTTTDLLDNLKVKGAVSSTGALFSTERLLQLCTDEMWDYVLPKVLKVRENYYQWDDDTALNATGKYPIHSRAAGGKLDNVFLIDATPLPTRKQNLVLMTENELEDYGSNSSQMLGLFFKRNDFYLVPASGTGWPYVRQQFFLRPGRFVETTDCAQIVSFDATTKVVTFTTVPTTWTTASLFDLIQSQPHFDTLTISAVITAITTGASGTLTFSASLPSGLAVGDWVCLAGETCIIQAPAEFHAMLARRVANICLGTLGREEAKKAGQEELDRLEKDLTSLISPRTNKQGKKIVNSTGLLRRFGLLRRW